MRVAIYDRVEPALPPQLPIRLSQTCSRREAVAGLALIVPLALGVLISAGSVLIDTVLVPEARAYALAHPAAGVGVIGGLIFLMYLLALPTRRLFARIVTTRNVYIEEGKVHVLEGSRLSSRSWSEPISSYLGVTAHMRTSLSGTRQEIILVHPRRDKSVLLSVAATTTQDELTRVAAMLATRPITPSALYRIRPLRETTSVAPLSEAAHA